MWIIASNVEKKNLQKTHKQFAYIKNLYIFIQDEDEDKKQFFETSESWSNKF